MSHRLRRVACVAIAGAVFLTAMLPPRAAFAHDPAGWALLLRLWELIVPDPRLEDLGRLQHINALLTWPVAVGLYSEEEHPVALIAFAEGQYSVAADAFRALAGARLDLVPASLPIGLDIQVAGVAATDGSGVMVGGGPTLRWGDGAFISAVYRSTWTRGDRRNSLGINMLVTVQTLFAD